MMPRIVLHLDMNSYFASVEQQANPHLRGKPVGVVATMTPNGCVIASSIEAKAVGIKTGVRVKDARQLDPQVILIPNNSDRYRSCTEGIFRILRRYSEDIETYSIDEAFLDLTGWVKNWEAATVLAERMRRDIQREVGEWLKCSIGVAPTRWLAKFAGDTAPKGGTLVVHQQNFSDTLDPHQLTDAWGIAKNMERRLNTLGIYTLGELRHYPVTNLLVSLHSMGYYLWANVNGLELPGLATPSSPKSIGHSHVFARRAESLDYPKAVLAKLCEKAGRRLRQLGLEAHGIWLGYGLPDRLVSYYQRSGGGGAELLPRAIVDTRDIFAASWKIFTNDLPRGALPNFLGLTLFRLRPQSHQAEIWPVGKHDPPALAGALDILNDKFGDFTVTRGAFLGLTDRDVPNRIGFRKTITFDAQTGTPQW